MEARVPLPRPAWFLPPRSDTHAVDIRTLILEAES